MAVTRPPLRTTEKWQRGRSGELLIARLLQKQGWYVIPSYDYSGDDGDKPPRLQGSVECFPIPDLDIAKDGQRRWAEVKTKAAASYTRITQRLEHGIPLRHYHAYQRVQEITGTEVWLFVYEESTGDILYGKLDDLAKTKRVYEGNRMSYGGMVFFPREGFALFARVPIEKTKDVT